MINFEEPFLVKCSWVASIWKSWVLDKRFRSNPKSHRKPFSQWHWRRNSKEASNRLNGNTLSKTLFGDATSLWSDPKPQPLQNPSKAQRMIEQCDNSLTLESSGALFHKNRAFGLKSIFQRRMRTHWVYRSEFRTCPRRCKANGHSLNGSASSLCFKTVHWTVNRIDFKFRSIEPRSDLFVSCFLNQLFEISRIHSMQLCTTPRTPFFDGTWNEKVNWARVSKTDFLYQCPKFYPSMPILSKGAPFLGVG